MNARLSGSAARRDKYFICEFANSCIAQSSERPARLHQDLLSNYRDILGSRRRVGLQSRLARRKLDVRRGAFVNTRCQRDNQDRVSPFMTIPGIHRHNNQGPAAFFRWIRR
jgi:hypothetical protein